MEKEEVFQDEFDNYFSKFKNVPIAVYGTGKNAKLLLKHIKGYDFFSVVSSEPIKENICGRPVVMIEEAIQKAKLILIAAIPSSTSIIYSRIKNKVPKEIPIYDMRGQKLNGDEYYRKNSYWKNKLDDLYQLVDSHDVISFDVFDTLIMRKVLQASDIFLIVENKLKQKGLEIPFAKWRMDTEEEISRSCPTINQIYQAIQDKYKLDKNSICECKKLEISTELDFICPRRSMVKLLEYAYKKRKKIYLTSDMYFPKEIMKEILDKCGINISYSLLVSCDYNVSKMNGGLYSLLNRIEKNKKILHIGDNYEIDILNAKKNNMDAFWIMSGYDILTASSIAYLVDSAKNLDDRIMVGNFVAEVFNDPFSLNLYRGKMQLNSFHNLSYCFIPITALFLNFILEKSSNYDLILFPSRDGYFLHHLYQLVNVDEIIKNRAKGVYIYASRSAVNRASVFNENDIKVVCNKLLEEDKLNIKYYLEMQFLLNVAEELDITVGQAIEQWEESGLWERILFYKNSILEIADKERSKYLAYIENLEIDKLHSIAIVDIVTQGTLVHGFSKMTEIPIELISLGTMAIPNKYIKDLRKVSSIYGNIWGNVDGISYSFSDLSELQLFIEVIYASLEGQFRGFDEDGQVMTLEYEYNKELVQNVQSEIEMIMRENNYFKELEISKELALAFLRILYSQNSDMNEDMKKRFTFCDPYDGSEKRCNLMERIG